MKSWIKNLLGVQNNNSSVAPLTLEEKNNLRDEFRLFLDAHPLPNSEPKQTFTYNLWSSLPMPKMYQMAVIVLLFGTMGTAYMAEYAEPRDEMMYLVKRNFNEGILKGVSSIYPELKAEVDQALLSRRLAEIEELIVDQAFMDQDAMRLRSDVSVHTSAIKSYISSAEKEGNLKDAFETHADLTTMLDAHNTVVSLLNNLEESTYEEELELFIRDIDSERSELRQTRKVLEDRSSLLSESDQQVDINLILEELKESTEELEEKKTEQISGLEEELLREIDFLKEQAKIAQQDALADVDLGSTKEAVNKLNSAVQNIEKATIVLESFIKAVEE